MTLQGSAIYAHLQTRPQLTALIGDRVFPRRMPLGATFPLVLYTRVSTSRSHTHSGPDGLPEPRIQFDVYGLDPDTVDATAQELRLALDGFRGQMGDVAVASVRVVGEHDVDPDDLETGLYRRTLDAQIQHEEAVA